MDQPIRAMARRFAMSLSTASTCQAYGVDTRRRASTPGVKMALGRQQPSSRTELLASLCVEEKEKHSQSTIILHLQDHGGSGTFLPSQEPAQHQWPKHVPNSMSKSTKKQQISSLSNISTPPDRDRKTQTKQLIASLLFSSYQNLFITVRLG